MRTSIFCMRRVNMPFALFVGLFCAKSTQGHESDHQKDEMRVSTKMVGKTVVKNSTYNGSISTLGKVEIDKATIKGSVKAAGCCSVENALINGAVSATGATTIEHSTIEQQVDITGELHLNNTTVKGSVLANGSCTAHKVNAREFNITGKTVVTESLITGVLRVIGGLTVNDSTIGRIDLTGNEAQLHNVTVDSIVVRRSTDYSHGITGWVASAFCRVFPYQEELTVVIDGTSVIKKITFESGKGRAIFKGKNVEVDSVVGGEIYRQQ